MSIERLEEALRGKRPPGSVASLDPEVLAVLAQAITAERHRQRTELVDALERSVKKAPLPLRPVIRKIVGA